MSKYYPLFTLLFLSACASSVVHGSDSENRNGKRYTHFLPDDAFQSLLSISKSNSESSAKMRKFQSLLCDQKRAKFEIRKQVVYRPPNTKNMPLDEALELRKRDLQIFRRFIQKEMIYESAGYSAWGGFSGGDPYTLEEYEELKRKYAPETEEDMSLLIAGFTFAIPLSEIARLNGIKDYTDKTYKSNYQMQYFGYDINSHTWLSSEALKHRDFLWQWILDKSTYVTEQPQENGDIEVTLVVNLNLFCAYSVSALDTISQ